MVQLVTQQDFKGEYPFISPNVNDAYFTPQIRTSQDKCSSVLGDALYADLMLKFSQNIDATYTSNIMPNKILLSVLDSSFYEVGGICQVFIKGYLTADTTQKEVLSKLFENVFVDVLNIPSGTDIELLLPFNVDLSLYTITELKLGKYLDVKYKTLYTLYLKPFLIYDIYAAYIVTSNLKSTNSGIMQHIIDTAQVPDTKLISMSSNLYKAQSDTYKEKTINFLSKNIAIYPLFNTAIQTEENLNFGNIGFLGSSKGKFTQGYF